MNKEGGGYCGGERRFGRPSTVHQQLLSSLRPSSPQAVHSLVQETDGLEDRDFRTERSSRLCGAEDQGNEGLASPRSLIAQSHHAVAGPIAQLRADVVCLDGVHLLTSLERANERTRARANIMLTWAVDTARARPAGR